jgi:hypothetical protein
LRLYAFQTGRDQQFGMDVPPDGRRFEYIALGGALNYDMPEIATAILEREPE